MLSGSARRHLHHGRIRRTQRLGWMMRGQEPQRRQRARPSSNFRRMQQSRSNPESRQVGKCRPIVS
eukprot:12414151-Karenia_brevis.AAC.1